MLMEAQQSAGLHQALLDASLLLPDGRPLCWWQQMINGVACEQVRGYDLVMALLQTAQQQQLKVALYGGHSADDLSRLLQVLAGRFPSLNIVFAYAPPIAPAAVLDPQQQQLLAASQADILLVGLGCPKQELFIQQYSAQLPMVQIGVGAVFDFIAGRRALPPRWAATCGLEWLFRWLQEPRRLTQRYLRYNPLFVARFIKAWMSKQ
jgi:N-acetylglucosaminyldiphosphoundecaprenol N-acetyl-beta-D-mannosaminyltransferase